MVRSERAVALCLVAFLVLPGFALGADQGTDYGQLLAADRESDGFLDSVRDTRTYPYIERAHRLIAAGDLAAARKDLEIYLDRVPDDDAARFTYAVVLQGLDDPAGAARAMSRVLKARPGFGPAHLYRGLARQREGDEVGAADDFEAAAKSDVLTKKDHEFALESWFDAAVKLGEDERALRALAALSKQDPTPERELRRATLLTEVGKSEEARAVVSNLQRRDLSPALRLDVLSLAFTLDATAGALAAARAEGEEARALAPKDPVWLDRLATIAEQQGDAAAAEGYRREAVKLAPTVERRRKLAIAADGAGDEAGALAAARSVVDEEAHAAGSPGATEEDLVRLAVLAGRTGKSAEAGRSYEEAYRVGDQKSPELLLRAAREYDSAGERQRARRLLERVAADTAASRDLRATSLTALADSDVQAGDDRAARQTLRRLVVLEGPSWKTQQALGDLALRSGDARAALDEYQRALRLRADPRTRLAMAYGFQKIGKPGLALHEIEKALAGGLPETQRLAALRTQGYLRAETSNWQGAAQSWSAANAIAPDPVLTLALARAQRLSGEPLAATEALASLDPATLTVDRRALYWSERSALAGARGATPVAVEDLDRAIVLQPTAARLATLGRLRVTEGRPKEARPPFERALAESGFQASVAAELGHVDLTLDDPDEAISLFESALAADPDLLSLVEDLGYTYVREARNEEAVARFEEAIDNEPFYPVDTDEEREALARRIERLRREVTELDRWISLVGYTSICFGDSNCRLGQTALIEGASESQGGAELSIRPPVIGFRNGRIFEVISRVLYQQEVNSIVPIGESLVATLGARYKPLQSQDLYLSVERIFGVGSLATDNTLLRASYGLLEGYRMQPGVPHWTYATLYVDGSYTAEPPRTWFVYVEGRVGQSFNYDDQALVTPLAYVRNRNLAGDVEDFNDVDVGVGVSLRWLWNDDRYHDYRSAFELMPRVGYDAYNSEGRGWNLFLTGVMQF